MNNNYQIVKNEVVNAYSDCNEISKSSRNLDFLASKSVSVKEAEEIMSLAVESGYNNFSSELISLLPQGAKVWIAREGSVCVYLDKPVDEKVLSELGCDEYDQVSSDNDTICGNYRIWWD